jgi:hypothetical protein
MVDFLLYSLSCWPNIEQAETVNMSSSVFSCVGVSAISESENEQHRSRVRTAIWAISNMARGSAPGAVFLNSGELIA